MKNVVVKTVEGKEKKLTGADLKEIGAGIASLSSEINEAISKALARVSHKQSSI